MATRSSGVPKAGVVTLALALALASPARAQLLVSHPEQGILRVGADGAVLESLSSTPAAVARRRDPTHVVFLVEGSNELRELDLASRTERVVATLPGDVGLGCGGNWGDPERPAEPYLVAAELEFASSFAVDGDLACFEVMDRNLNMASVIAQIAVNLRTGAITSWITAAESCEALDDAARAALPCRPVFGRGPRAREGRPAAGSWRLDAGDPDDEEAPASLVGPSGARRRLAVRAPEVETVSPNGRWAVLGGNPDVGDYIYRSLWLLDLRAGRVHGLPRRLETDDEERAPDAPIRWLPPMSAAALRDAEAMVEAGYGVTGETSLRWTGPATLLVGERLVVRPHRAAVLLPGPVVR